MSVKETRPIFFVGNIMFGIRMGELRKARLPRRFPLLMFCWDRDAMLSISIEKQRKRPPFSKLCLAHGWAGGQAGAQRQTRQTKEAKYLLLVLNSKGNARHFFCFYGF